MIIMIVMMAVVMGSDDLENKRGDQINMAMVGLLTVQKNYFNCFLYANIMILVFNTLHIGH